MARKALMNNVNKTFMKMEEAAGFGTPVLMGTYEQVASQLAMSVYTFKSHLIHLEHKGWVNVETFSKGQKMFFINVPVWCLAKFS